MKWNIEYIAFVFNYAKTYSSLPFIGQFPESGR